MVVKIIKTTLTRKQTELNRTPCRKFIHEFFTTAFKLNTRQFKVKQFLTSRDNSNVCSPKQFHEQPISNEVK